MTSPARRAVALTVNGEEVTTAAAEPRTSLADLLRDELGATSVHLGCEHGSCGACTVLLDGDAVRSCLVLGVQAEGCEIVTLEGFAGDDLHPLQAAFRDAHSFQCGFCTPGFVVSAYTLLRERRPLTEAQIRAGLAGNLCRCTGYQSIVAGVQLAAQRLGGAAPPAPGSP